MTKKYKIEFGKDYNVELGKHFIAISNKKGEVIRWVEDEWIEDPSIVLSIVNAVKMACEGKDIKKVIRS